MPRPPRRLVDDGCYHVIARGNNHQPLFQDEAALQCLLGCLRKMKQRYPAKLYHYCLLSNHVHFLIQVEKGPPLSKFMQGMVWAFARWFQRRTAYIGHVWQGRYHNPLIADELYFLEAGRYIERNPIRAGLVLQLQDHPWSSYRYYAHGAKDELVDEDPYYRRIGFDPARRQAAYRDFVSLAGAYEEDLDRALLHGRSGTSAQAVATSQHQSTRH